MQQKSCVCDNMRIADVYINLPIKSIAKSFSYLLPDELGQVGVGWRVLVPFGGRSVEGFVVRTYAAQGDGEDACACPFDELKSVQDAVDEEAWFSPLMIEAAEWLADFYLCSVGEIMRLFMPGKSGVKIQLQYEAVPDVEEDILLTLDIYKQVYKAIAAEGACSPRILQKRLLYDGYNEAAGQLEKILQGLLAQKLITRVYNAQQRAKAAYENCLFLLQSITQADIEKIEKRKRGQRLLAIWLIEQAERLGQAEQAGEAGNSGQAEKTAQAKQKRSYSFSELAAAGFSTQVIKGFCSSGWAEIRKERVLRNSYQDFAAARTISELTDAQQKAVGEIAAQLTERINKTFLLYGVTGSGKTQVYIEAAKKARSLGRTVVVLVPEIALTGQLVQAFKAYFARDIIVMHSRLSINERNDAIFRIRTGQTGIVIGARSALFTPLDNVGLIIMDEEQDNSYKQDESPRYHARVVAKKLAELHHAVLLLGSATPSLETYYHAIKGEYGLLKMPERIGSRPLPQVVGVDMRQELKLGRRSVISQTLRNLIEETLAKKEQMILMLNRRGYSTFIMCRSCGEAIKCPNCTMPMVFHRDGRLLCHHCDIQLPVPTICPKCQSTYIKYFGTGTEKLEQELEQLVPHARIVRMDRDTTSKKFAHTEILDKFKKGEYDILLGTQMVAKGHDIPNVTAVGILSADSTLNMPDFRAAERVFMLITQTAGRAGRGKVAGRVVVQCYNPEHFAVQRGLKQDYEGFFQEEMRVRKALFNPPYSRLIKLIFQHKSEQTAREMAEKLKDDFVNYFVGSPLHQAVGPAPAMMSCLNGIYRFALLLKAADVQSMLKFLREKGLDKNMQVMVDIDPLTTS